MKTAVLLFAAITLLAVFGCENEQPQPPADNPLAASPPEIGKLRNLHQLDLSLEEQYEQTQRDYNESVDEFERLSEVRRQHFTRLRDRYQEEDFGDLLARQHDESLPFIKRVEAMEVVTVAENRWLDKFHDKSSPLRRRFEKELAAQPEMDKFGPAKRRLDMLKNRLAELEEKLDQPDKEAPLLVPFLPEGNFQQRAANQPISLPEITPPLLGSDRVTVSLNDRIEDLVIGGGGRYLVLRLANLNQLVVFDVAKAKVIKQIPLESDEVLFAASADSLLFVAQVRRRLLVRWNLNRKKDS